MAIHQVAIRVGFETRNLIADAIDKIIEHRQNQATLVAYKHTHFTIDRFAPIKIQLGLRLSQEFVEMWILEPRVIPVCC